MRKNIRRFRVILDVESSRGIFWRFVNHRDGGLSCATCPARAGPLIINRIEAACWDLPPYLEAPVAVCYDRDMDPLKDGRRAKNFHTGCGGRLGNGNVLITIAVLSTVWAG